ncbi:MAG: PorV/PorQ family protein [Bacteroidota bacterium]
MKKLITIFILSAMTLIVTQAQQIKTGLPFLKLSADARSSAMGEAFTSITNDHSSYYYNPASIRFSNLRQLMISHRQGFSETTTDYIGATIPGETFTFGLSAYTTSVNDIEVRLRPGEAEGTFGARNGAIGVGAAISLSDEMTVGLTGKLLYEKIYTDEASGYGIDAGFFYKAFDNVNIGVSLLNFGSMSVLRSERSVLPTTIRLGASYSTLFTPDFSLLFAGDAVKTLDDEITHLHFGTEAVYDSMFMIRAGYQTGYEVKSFTGGVGIAYGIIRFDYAFVPMKNAFSPNHTFSLTFLL